MPIGGKTKIKEDDDGNLMTVASVSHRTRFFILTTIILPRFFVNVSLLYVGCKYISITFEFEEIVLNCVALMFVLDMDEILYGVFLPRSVQTAVGKFKSVKVRRVIILHDVEVGDAVRWCCMGIVLFMAWSFTVAPAVEVFREAVRTLCPDEKVAEASLW